MQEVFPQRLQRWMSSLRLRRRLNKFVFHHFVTSVNNFVVTHCQLITGLTYETNEHSHSHSIWSSALWTGGGKAEYLEGIHSTTCKLHTESPQSESNPRPSRCEVTALATASPWLSSKTVKYCNFGRLAIVWFAGCISGLINNVAVSTVKLSSIAWEVNSLNFHLSSLNIPLVEDNQSIVKRLSMWPHKSVWRRVAVQLIFCVCKKTSHAASHIHLLYFWFLCLTFRGFCFLTEAHQHKPLVS